MSHRAHLCVIAHKQAQNTAQDIETLYKEVEMAATATHEMSATVQEVARNASQTSVAAEESRQNVGIGKNLLQQAMWLLGVVAFSIPAASLNLWKLYDIK